MTVVNLGPCLGGMLGNSDDDRTTDFCSSLLDKIKSLKDSQNERLNDDSEISEQLNGSENDENCIQFKNISYICFYSEFYACH